MTLRHAGQDSIWALVFAAWLVALTAALGALFLGEVMGMTPCVLCWYQRISMFPLVLVLGVGLLPCDARSSRYGLPLAAVGWIMALYHCWLYWGVFPPDLVPCGPGASCSQIDLQLLGFITIPLLSLTAFTLILALLIFAQRGIQK